MAGLHNWKGTAALIALILGLLTLSLAPTVAQRPGGRSLVGHPGLRPDWARLPLAMPAPAPAAIEAAPAEPPERPGLAPAPEQPSPTVETVLPPTIEAPLPAPPEPIAIAAVSPLVDAPPSASAAAPPTASPTAPPVPTVMEGLDTALAQAIVELTNQARLANGLNPLAEHPALVAAAQEYADLHAHLSPDQLDHRLNGSTIDSRAEAEGYSGWTFLAENLVWSDFDPPLSPEEAVQQWLASPAHRDNMLNPMVSETGVGCYVSTAERPFFICVQDFGARA